MSPDDWPQSPFRRAVDRSAHESDTISGNRAARRRHALTLGRVLFLFEIYLFVATQGALSSDTFIAPPMLIFFMLHHWMALFLTVAFICSCEFCWRPTWLTGLILFLMVIAAGVGYALVRAR
jgi:uncharacterized membrane protein